MKKGVILLLALFSYLFSNAEDEPFADTRPNYIETWGKLRLVDDKLCNQFGEKIQLKGWSFPEEKSSMCEISKETLFDIKQSHANCIRVSKVIESDDSLNEEDILQIIDWAQEFGLYVVVDWHNPSMNRETVPFDDPTIHQTEAATFFSHVASHVAGHNYKHVIYELYNEPGALEWKIIKEYAETLIDTIVQHDHTEPIVVVGTPNWCLDPSVILGKDRIKNEKANVMYAFHACVSEANHDSYINVKLKDALQRLPIFATCVNPGHLTPSSNEEQDINFSKLDNFMAICEEGNDGHQLISWIGYSYGIGKAGIFKDSCSVESMTTAGQYLFQAMREVEAPKEDPDVTFNYIDSWGKLIVIGDQICSEKNFMVQLRGWNLPDERKNNIVFSKKDLKKLKETGANCFRVPRNTTGGDGFTTEEIKHLMDWSQELGLYMIINWHNPYDDISTSEEVGLIDILPTQWEDEATLFFDTIATHAMENHYKHIIYEPFHETSEYSWDPIKAYSERMIERITAIDTTQPLIVVPTPAWDQHVYQGVYQSPIKSSKAHIAYAFHVQTAEPYSRDVIEKELDPASKKLPILATSVSPGYSYPIEHPNSTPDENAFYKLYQIFNRQNEGGQSIGWIACNYGKGLNGVFTDKLDGSLTLQGNALFQYFVPITFDESGMGTNTEEKISEIDAYYSSHNGELTVRVNKPTPVRIYNVMGELKASKVIQSNQSFQLPQGIYLMQIGDQIGRVIVH